MAENRGNYTGIRPWSTLVIGTARDLRVAVPNPVMECDGVALNRQALSLGG